MSAPSAPPTLREPITTSPCLLPGGLSAGGATKSLIRLPRAIACHGARVRKSGTPTRIARKLTTSVGLGERWHGARQHRSHAWSQMDCSRLGSTHPPCVLVATG